MREVLISFLFALVVGSAVNGYLRPSATADAEPKSTGAGAGSGTAIAKAGPALAETNAANFQTDVLASTTPVLVEFSASWCAPCRIMKPTMSQLASDYQGKVKIFRLDVDGNPTVADQYKVKVLPTFMLFQNGKPVETSSGFQAKEDLAASIDKHLQ